MAKTWRRIFVLASLAFALFATVPAAAQSGGCAGGPFAGATTLDSDGDGVNDSDEVSSGTDECDPNSTPTFVCGGYVNGYNAAAFDSDNDSYTDAAETAAGTDPCDPTSVIAAAVTTTTAAPSTTTAAPTPTTVDTGAGTGAAAQQAPTLALTGPSTATLTFVVGLAMVLLGAASLAVGRRVDA